MEYGEHTLVDPCQGPAGCWREWTYRAGSIPASALGRHQGGGPDRAYAGLEGVVQGWYLHVLALRTAPGWAERWDAVRREPPRLVPGDARSLEDVLTDLEKPRSG